MVMPVGSAKWVPANKVKGLVLKPANAASPPVAKLLFPCPKCGRSIPLQQHELSLTIECSQCGARFLLSQRAAQASDTDKTLRRGSEPRRLPLLPVVFLVLGLLVPVGHDAIIFLWNWPEWATDNGSDQKALRLVLQFHDKELSVVLGRQGVKPINSPRERGAPAIWEPSMRFGLAMIDDQPKISGVHRPRRLTFEPDGLTNNTCVWLNGNQWLFGERPFRRDDGLPTGDWPGRWVERDTRLDETKEGRRSVWIYDREGVHVTQTVQLVIGPQSAIPDTCLVRYRIDNRGSQRHTVGLRFMLDTFIGENDGVPFLIPGSKELCSTSMIRTSEQIPDFIQALESEDLQNPGTIAHLQLKLGGVLEAPSRLTLGAWPNVELRSIDSRCNQEKTLWDVPVLPIRSVQPSDSAVVIYWEPKRLDPGDSREMGFTYGLGRISGGEGGGKLALTLGGSFGPGGEFTVAAYVSDARPGQTLTLTMPDNFEAIDGAMTQAVPQRAASRNSPVSWKVRAPMKQGLYTLKVQSSTGSAQTQKVRIQTKGIFGN
jgi:hypothetical protein